MNNTTIINMLAENNYNAEEITTEKGGLKVTVIAVRSKKGKERFLFYPEEDPTLSEMEFVGKIIEIMGTNQLANINQDILNDWNFIKDKLFLDIRQVINGTETVTEKWLDLELFTYIRLNDMTIKIDTYMLEHYGISKLHLFKKAKGNMRKNYVIYNISEMMSGKGLEMYVVTLPTFHGAAAICDEEIADKLCDKLNTNKIIIIPSSIHETIILNAYMFSYDQAVSMVREVNQTCVNPVDILSENIYIYDKLKETYYVYDGN